MFKSLLKKEDNREIYPLHAVYLRLSLTLGKPQR